MAVVLFALPASAGAKKRVVVLTFTGSGDELQNTVAELLADEHTLVSEGAFRRAAGRLGVEPDGDQAFASISADLAVDAVVLGHVEPEGRRWRAAFIIREGASGRVSTTFDLLLRSREPDAAARRTLAARLANALARVSSVVEAEPAAPRRQSEGPTGTRTRSLRDGQPDAKPPAAATDPADPAEHEDLRDEPEGLGQEGGDADEGAEEEAVEDTGPDADEGGPLAVGSASRSADRAVDVALGVGIVQRTMSFTSAESLTNAQKPNGYKGALVPAVVLVGEVYPLAFSDRPSALDRFGIAVVAERALFLKSRLGSAEYETSQTRLGAGLRYRHAFGAGPSAPVVKVGAGFTQLSFAIERGDDDIDFPNVTYRYVDLGASGHVPLGTPRFAIYLDARYLAVLSSGEIATRRFYGGGSILGLDTDGGLEIRPTSRQSLKVGARYQRMAFDFDGTGDSATMRDGDPDQDVGGAVDQYLGGYVTFGYLF